MHMSYSKRAALAAALIIGLSLIVNDRGATANAGARSELDSETSQKSPAGSSSGIQPPPQAAAAGDTRLDFYDNFDYPDLSFLAFGGAPVKTWSASVWYKAKSAGAANFNISSSVLTIYNNAISTIQNSSPFPGRTWLGGYFEARLYCAAHCGFYLGSYAWVKLSSSEGNQAAGRDLDAQYGGADEIDIFEGYGNGPNQGSFTLHSSGVGAGQGGYGAPDKVKTTGVKFNTPLIRAWHTYGLLWTKEKLYWYVDNQLCATAPAYRSTWQPSFLIIDVAPDGWSKLGAPNDEVITKVDWVRVWEPPQG